MQADRSTRRSATHMGLGAIVLATGWALAIRPLILEWWVNPQFQFGFLVPLLCLVLLRGRIQDRPAAESPGNGGRRLALAVAAVCALTLAAVQPVYVANPGWRLVEGVSGLAIVALTLALVYLRGGGLWLRHFAFPIAFFLIAVPLPYSMEETLMNWLMHKNAGATVEVLSWLGYDVAQSGNLIRLPAGVLGVEEACSGVRSLRSGIMAALFVGEFFRVAPVARLGLLVLAVGTALVGNLLRTLFLAIIASAGGIKAVDVWHDPAGMTILLLVIFVVWFTAAKMEGPPPAVPAGGAEASPLPGLPVRLWVVAAAGCFWLLALGATEWWFRSHERDWTAGPAWSLELPRSVRNARIDPISDRVAEQLRYDSGLGGSWVDSAGLRGQFFYFRWEPSSLFPSQVTTGHRPESCLAGIGMELDSRLGIRVFEKGGVSVPFRAYRFRDKKSPVYVFHAFVEDLARSDAQQAIPDDGSYQSRWQSVRHGKRNRGQRVVEIAVWGAADFDEAEKALKEFMEQAMVVEDARPQRDDRYSRRP